MGTCSKSCFWELGRQFLLGSSGIHAKSRWWRPRTVTVHILAVRLCALVYFCAFYGVVLDGPIMWALMPPIAGWTAEERLFCSKVGMLFAFVACVFPRLWPALALCWYTWHQSHTDGGMWFGFGWDPMLDDVGFLSLLLSVTLTVYDDLVEESVVDDLFSDAESRSEMSLAADIEDEQGESSSTALLVDRRNASKWAPCSAVNSWAVLAAELSQTLSAFRLFAVAGVLKMKMGSECWRDLTCLYTHFYTQPMPNPVACFFHNWTTAWMKRFMQWFAIDVGECFAPYLLLGFLISTGPVGALHKKLRRSVHYWYIAAFPSRLVGSALMVMLLLGMFVSGNYAFLHPLSAVCLLASCGTARCVAIQRRDVDPWTSTYRIVASAVVITLAVFAMLPGYNTVQWLLSANADVIGSNWAIWSSPMNNVLQSNMFIAHAKEFNLGMDHYRYAYFAGAVEERNEFVLTAKVGNKWIELDIPCKVGSVDRAPCVTSPLHRRFAWQLWYPFGERMFDYPRFFSMLCQRDLVAWDALEYGAAHQLLQDGFNITALAKETFSYRFSKHGEAGWWVRESLGERESFACPIVEMK